MVDLKRKLTFSAWADGAKKLGFDPVAAATALAALPSDQQVHTAGDAVTAVEVIATGHSDSPTQLRLLALHDADNAPSSWGPGSGAAKVDFGDGRYSVFFTHVTIWPDKVVAHDVHANAPGLGRLADYMRAKTDDQRVIFRALYEQGLVEELKDLDGMRGLSYGIHRAHKVAAARERGFLGPLLPNNKAAAFSMSLGMSRRGKRDAYLPDDVSEAIVAAAESADEIFDRLIVRGPSKTLKTDAGNPKTIEVNLLGKRLHVAVELPRDPENPAAVQQADTFSALSSARATLEADDKIEHAAEARLLLDQP